MISIGIKRFFVVNKAQRHVDILILHFDLDIHVDISTLSILLDMQNRHGGEKYGRKREEEKGNEKVK